MNEGFVTSVIAKKLKEKGFREKCLAYYTPYGGMLFFNTVNVDKRPTGYEVNFTECKKCYNCYLENNIDAPTISQVLEWLRKNRKLHISTKPYPCEDGLMWMYEVRKFSSVLVCVVANETGFQEPEQAELAGIKYVFDNLI